MADEDDLEIDPAIAEAMGFSGFGVQAGKKRKYNSNDTFVDPGLAKDSSASKGKGTAKGANSLPLGARKPGKISARASTAHAEDVPQQHVPQPAPPGIEISPGVRAGASGGVADLQALRQGVKNERGDMVYFMPSFLEDPWKDLKPN